MAGMYGFNRYAPGQQPGTMQFFGGPQGRLQLGAGNLANKIRQSIDRPDPRKAGMAAGGAANAAARGVGPTAQGQAAGAAAAQAATNASAGAQPLPQFARGQAMAPRPPVPGGNTPDYGLGRPMTTPSAPAPRVGPPPSSAIPGGTMPRAPGPAPGQSSPMPDPSGQIAALSAPPQTPPGSPAPGQAPMVDPGAMVSTLNTTIDPNNYQAHPVGGRTILLRNGADPANATPQDVMVFENGQWVPGGDEAANELYDQLHIEDIGE